jgi:uncharacterized protein YqeY
MILIEKINEDFMSAFKAREIEEKNFLGVLKTEITKESKTPEDTYIVGKIKSMIKSAEATNSLTESELKILGRYLPSQMDELELKTVCMKFIMNIDSPTAKDMGLVMGFLKENYGGTYDGGMASKIVKELLV